MLICGIRDRALHGHMLQELEVNLEKAIQAGQSVEETRRQSKIINTSSETENISDI